MAQMDQAQRFKPLLFDTETLPTNIPEIKALVQQEAREKEPPANWKSDDAMAKWDAGQEERATEAFLKTSVDPLYARLACLVLKIHKAKSPIIIDAMTLGELNALRLLVAVLESDDFKGHTMIYVAHNGMAFDLPIILNRFRYYGIEPPASFPVFRGNHWGGDSKIYDTMLNTPSKNYKGMISLHASCLGMGIPMPQNPVPITGADVYERYQAGDYQSITGHCVEDVVDLLEPLFNKLTYNGTVYPWGSYELLIEQFRAIAEAPYDESTKDRMRLMAAEKAGRIPSIAGNGSPVPIIVPPGLEVYQPSDNEAWPKPEPEWTRVEAPEAAPVAVTPAPSHVVVPEPEKVIVPNTIVPISTRNGGKPLYRM